MIDLNEGYREILDTIASDSPTPGGGSVAALSLAHAHALVCMVARLTLKSGKWESGHVTAENALAASDVGISVAIDLAHRDAESFDSVILAFRMPKSTEDEIYDRQRAISEGYIGASRVPLLTAESGLELLKTLREFATDCNAHAITDLAAAAQLAQSAIDIAALNIKINLEAAPESTLDNFEEASWIWGECGIEKIEAEAVLLTEEISEVVSHRM